MSKPAPDSTHRREVIVFAAASLKDVCTELGKALEARDSTVKITFSFAASNVLARQIETGAPADVFISAGSEIMDSLQAHGAIDASTRRDAAGNALVVVGPSGAHPLAALEEITRPEYKRIAIAAPGVPARVYAEEALRKAGLWEQVEKRCVFGENVRQVVEYAANGDADIAFVYSTDAVQFDKRVSVVWRVATNLHRPIRYPVAVVHNAHNPDGARAFRNMLVGSDGHAALRRYGFTDAAMY